MLLKLLLKKLAQWLKLSNRIFYNAINIAPESGVMIG
jgi:hypothetical protein